MNPLLGLLASGLSQTPLGGLLGMGAPQPAPAPMGAPAPAAAGLPASLVGTESGGNLRALNREGYGGRGQFGDARLMDAYRAGVIDHPMTGAEYSQAPEAVQIAVENWQRNDILDKLGGYVGTDVDGAGPIPPLTPDSLVAVAHLGGIPGARRFIESGGRYDPADSNGTNLSDYAMTHAGGSRAPTAMAFADPEAGSMSNASTSSPSTGSTPPMGLLTMPPEPERRPSIWDRAEGVPGLGLLADPDRRHRLAIALAGMSLRPNQGLIETLKGDLADSRDQEKQQRLAAWLGSQDNPTAQNLGAMIAAGLDGSAASSLLGAMQPPEPMEINGRLVDPRTLQVLADFSDQPAPTTLSPGQTAIGRDGQVLYTAPDAPQPQSSIVTGEAAAALGLDPNGSYNVTQGPNGLEAHAVGGGGTTVNVGTGETAFARTTGELQAKEAAAIVDQAAVAQRSLGQVQALGQILQSAPQGLTLSRIGASLGLPVEGKSDYEAGQALIAAMIPSQRPPGSGPMSDGDVALFAQSLPSLLNTPQGNKMIVDTLTAVSNYDIERGKIARQLQLGNITQQQAADAYAALGNPIPEFIRNGGVAPQGANGFTPAPQTAAPAAPAPAAPATTEAPTAAAPAPVEAAPVTVTADQVFNMEPQQLQEFIGTLTDAQLQALPDDVLQAILERGY